LLKSKDKGLTEVAIQSNAQNLTEKKLQRALGYLKMAESMQVKEMTSSAHLVSKVIHI
jgi:prolyl-tRNA editing enzyme YbaK/EbsC (Cys-tRNA(Pro) deacylase)